MNLIDVVSVFLQTNDDSYLLQLRDNDPSIVYSGYWGLFGGSMEEEESPHDAIVRELQEEIHYVPEEIYEFRQYQQQNRRINVCYAKIGVPVSELKLKEGVDLGLFSVKEISRGQLYSQKLQAYFPVPSLLQEYFQDFLKWNLTDESSITFGELNES
tara:strand:- start:254 stop:724 length:471 start_codon:yes stop_codon:yes gene_type:complete